MTRLDLDILAIDAASEVDRIASWLRDALRSRLHRRGLVLGISGGVDSAVCAALSVRAVGKSRVFGLLMPERDSSEEGQERARAVATQLGIAYRAENITSALEALGCYRERDEAIRSVLPEYDGSWPHKLAIRGGMSGRINSFVLVAQRPDGTVVERRLDLSVYLTVVAATNFKQRVRKTLEYYHADRLNYAVVGTPNRVEYDQGFFVKNGDGSADAKPIAHLYKTQVYALGKHLDVPAEVLAAAPTTDTYSMVQGQDEFYFALPYQEMDLALWSLNHGVPASELAERLGIGEEDAAHVYRDIESKRRATAYLHLPELVMDRIFSPDPNPAA